MQNTDTFLINNPNICSDLNYQMCFMEAWWMYFVTNKRQVCHTKVLLREIVNVVSQLKLLFKQEYNKYEHV